MQSDIDHLPKRKRRWFQFRLRSLMIGVTLLAVVCGYVGWQAKIVRERAWMLNWEFDPTCPVVLEEMWDNRDERYNHHTVPWLRMWLGDSEVTLVELKASANDETVNLYKTAFPEAKVSRRSP